MRDRVLGDAACRAAYLGHFDDRAADILALEPHRIDTRSVLRFDSFLAPDGPHFVEVNGDIPMGRQSNDALMHPMREPFFRVQLGFCSAANARQTNAASLRSPHRHSPTVRTCHARSGWRSVALPGGYYHYSVRVCTAEVSGSNPLRSTTDLQGTRILEPSA